ncbi:MAG TPA: UDP-N-acetylmuramate dehydrogenase [Terriglobales bacterium]|jgi:UDP-N-acetylmuramate dehydrogenase
MLVQEQVPLAPRTTIKVGGPARFFVEARNTEDARAAVEFARSKSLALFVLGGGSNLVVSDKGWPGLVLKIAISGIEQRSEAGPAIFEVGAGEEWDKFVAFAVGKNCAGVECLSGIPGSVGGTPVQNVGAYGQEVAETIESVHALEVETLEVREIAKQNCGFSYRSSIFNTTERGRYIILKTTYSLTPGGTPKTEYADLKKYFAGWRETPTLADAREAVRQIRARKGMLITPGDPDCKSAGSFFKNPILSPEQHDELLRRAALRGLQVPSYPALESQKKVSAAWLVEHSGFSKGFIAGKAGISRKHALAIVNRGQASALDILSLKEQIQGRVKEIWGVQLEPEPVMVGF